METTFIIDNDKLLLEKLKARIRWDIRVSNSDISMTVKNSRVQLIGFFDEAFRHDAAISILINTEGVSGLIDKSQVLNDYHRNDRDIEKLIAKQILTLDLQRDEWIEVDVHRGVVRFTGAVYQAQFKAFASHAAWELSGVKDCINLISLSALSQISMNATYPWPMIRPFFGRGMNA